MIKKQRKWTEKTLERVLMREAAQMIRAVIRRDMVCFTFPCPRCGFHENGCYVCRGDANAHALLALRAKRADLALTHFAAAHFLGFRKWAPPEKEKKDVRKS